LPGEGCPDVPTLAIALVLSGLAAAPAFAQEIVKCTDANGSIECRNSACPQGTRREAVQVSNLSIIEAERRGGVDRRSAVDRQGDAGRASRVPAEMNRTVPGERR
jgi:hypothetical protein